MRKRRAFPWSWCYKQSKRLAKTYHPSHRSCTWSSQALDLSIWLYEGRLHIAYQEAVPARYAYRYDRKARRLNAVETPRIFRRVYASPQLEFWELDDEQWRKIGRRPYELSPILPESDVRQLLLPDTVGAVT